MCILLYHLTQREFSFCSGARDWVEGLTVAREALLLSGTPAESPVVIFTPRYIRSLQFYIPDNATS